jgi:uncharacterized protein (TIGR03000 family)
MVRHRPALLLLVTLLLTTGVPCLDQRASGAPEGHGGGRRPGGPVVGIHPGFRGFYGYGPGYRRFYGYPGWYGVGLGFGIGCGLAYPWGYPYYAYPYGYPVYVDPIAVAPPAGAPACVPGGPVQAGFVQPVRLTEADVLLSVRVPPDAVVKVNGVKTMQTGPRRELMSSGLLQGRSYTFTISAQWTGPNGEPVEVQRRIAVQGGERRTIDFLIPSPATSEAPPVGAVTR